MNFFDLLEMEPGFDVSLSALEEAYFAKQREHHPDKMAGKSEADRLAAVQLSMQLNDAYETLKNPVRRAEYLLMTQGKEAPDAHDTIDDPALLMEMMELREQMAEASSDGRALMAMIADTKKAANQSVKALSEAFTEADYEAAQAGYLRLQYLHKALEEAHIILYQLKAQHEKESA